MSNKSGLFLGLFVFALVWLATDRFASPDQELVASTDVTVRATAPTVNDDLDFNFLAGYIWIDAVGGAVYICEDASDGAAVWTDITAGGSTFNAEEGDSLVISNVSVIDFGAGFDLTESPSGELNVVLDYTEDAVILTGSEVTGTLDISDHTNLVASTGLTLTGDTLTVDLGTTIDTSEIVDGTILEADLKAVDSANDEECLTFETTTGDFEWQPCASGGTGTVTTIEDGDVQVGDADIVTIDFQTGITCSESPDTEVNCSATLGTAIDTSEITDDTILEADLDAVDAAADEECLTFESGAGGDFEWQSCGSGGTGTLNTVNESDVPVGDADIATLDFGAGFDLTESPDTEINVVLDYTEDPVNLGGAEVTGTLDVSDHINLTCGTNCTLTGDEISVDDAFLLNNGDTGTGTYDFGGADDVEIPNGTGPTVDTAGQIAIDTTGDQLIYFGGAERVVTFQFTKSFALEDPADADSILLWEVPFDITIVSWSCIVDPGDTGESVAVDLQETDATGDSGASIDAAVTCDNDEANDDGTLSNPTLDAGDYLLLDIGTVTGTVTWLSGSIVYTVDAT